jgi:NAD(P)-dependent dehydrogenase (short-subunit alcohol dehydrogenase family)
MLTGKTIVVTGCASGIGAETAAELKRQGATVIGLDRNEGGNVDRFIQVDLTDPDQIDAAVAELPDGLAGLCNIAGLPPTAPAETVVTVNAMALRYLTERVVDKIADGGSITNVASLAGIGWQEAIPSIKELLAIESRDFQAVSSFCERNEVIGARSYMFSKEFVVAWTYLNRWTWRDRGIRMNSVSPGPVDTPILPDFLATLGERAEEDMAIMDRPGLPSDIAPVIAFLQSDGSGWLRGANLTADGGMSSHIAANMSGLEP